MVLDTVDILTMWSAIEYGYGRLTKKQKDHVAADAEPFGKHLVFVGFDGQLGIAHFLINKMGRFEEFRDRSLNSHAPLPEAYRRMLVVFNGFKSNLMGTALGACQIVSLMNAMRHSSKRIV